ncbi:hypothetical protein [Spiroplasma endosymbiont of Dasysyrphus albostriatus]|uniref:hypothetical protein n=1 Tax=Spiroplasma endosymbiont of Dasysyrphus albostriatus TaxID=3066299 RepID=UPI0030D62CCF
MLNKTNYSWKELEQWSNYLDNLKQPVIDWIDLDNKLQNLYDFISKGSMTNE